MSAAIVIPVKPFAEAKQRLAGAMGGERREALSRSFFEHVLAIAMSFRPAVRVQVVSRSEEILAFARHAGAEAVSEQAEGHNPALEQVMAALKCEGDRPILILSSDLPLLSGSDVAAMLALEGQADIGIATDAAGEGTNALFLSRPCLIPLRFGPGSCAAHRKEAEGAGLRSEVIDRPGLARDIDSPDDLIFLPQRS